MSEVERTAKATLRANREKKAPWWPQITRMSDVQPEAVQYLLNPQLPLGKYAMLEGDPSIGKTFLAVTFTALVTNGVALSSDYDGTVQPRNVIYMTAEDGLADTIRPRLDAAGADASRVYVIEGKETEDDDGDTKTASITLQDLATLEIAIDQVKPALVIIDPVQGFMGAGTDMNKANDVREILRGFANLAEKYNFSALAIRHLRKSGTDRAIHRGMGSIDFAAFARSILLVAEDPNEAGVRVMAHSKSSLAPAGPSLRYHIVDGRIEWLGESPLTADELLAPRDYSVGQSPRDEAKEWLQIELQEGPLPVKDIRSLAKDAGHSWRTIERAKSELGVIAERSEPVPSSPWQWRLKDV